jgi:hypothetical protein
MNSEMLESATTIDLLIELLYDGKSRIIPALEPFEPIPPQDLCAVLTRRHGVRLGDAFVEWFNWFCSDSDQGVGSDEERKTLTELKAFKDKTDPLFERARKARDARGQVE